MESVLRITVLALAVLAFASLAAAGEVPLLDGHMFKGTIEEVTDDGLRIRVNLKDGGTATIKLSANNIEPIWWFGHQEKRAGDDVKKRLALAVWAAEHGLFRQAKGQLDRARHLDAKETGKWLDDVLPTLREGIAKDLVRSAHRMMDIGHYSDARKMASAVIKRLGDTHAAGEARSLIPKLQERMDRKIRHRAYMQASEDKLKGFERAREIKEIMSPMVAIVEQGNHILAQGGTAPDKSSSIAHDRRAAHEFHTAIGSIDARIKHHADDAVIVKKLQDLRKTAVSGYIQTHVNLADIYLSRGDFNDVRAQAQALAKVAPDAPETHQIEQRVGDEEEWGQGTGSLTGGFYSRSAVYRGAMHRGTNRSRGRGR